MIHLWELFKAAWAKWNADDAPRLGASLAYYTLLSLAPLLVVLVTIIGFAFGDKAATGQLHEQLQSLIGGEAAKTLEAAVRNARAPATGTVATIVSLLTLFLGASGVLAELKSSLNKIWQVHEAPGNWLILIKERALSFAMVMGIGFVFLVSLVVSTAVSFVGKFISSLLPFHEAVLAIIDLSFSFGVTTVLFALLFKFLPDVSIRWSDVWIGALATAVLFSVGKFALAIYLGKASVGSPYGAAGSVVVLLVWIYYAAQIFLLGAEFTQVYAGAHAPKIIQPGSLVGSARTV
jgi:membrane protein